MRLAGTALNGSHTKDELRFDYDPRLFLKLFNYSVDKEIIELVVGSLDYTIIIDSVDHDDDVMWAEYRKVWPLWR